MESDDKPFLSDTDDGPTSLATPPTSTCQTVCHFTVHLFIFTVVLVGLVVLRITYQPDETVLRKPTSEEIQVLIDSLSGAGYVEGSLGYTLATRLYAATRKKPLLLIQPSDEDDILRALAWSRNYDEFPFSVKVGGHSAASYCLNDGGLVLDLSKFFKNIIWGENNTLIAQGGLTWVEVYNWLNGTGRMLPGGQCGTVGVVGWSVGGGFSPFASSWGLGVDNVVRFRVITSDGIIVEADETTEPDLYWALRGGGGGNFGIVTSLTFKTYPLLKMATGSACWNDLGISARNALNFFYQHVDDAPSDMHFLFYIYSANTTTTGFCLFGTPNPGNYSMADLTTWFQPLCAHNGSCDISEGTFYDFAQLTYLNNNQSFLSYQYIKSAFFNRTVENGVFTDLIFDASLNNNATGTEIIFEMINGASAAVSPTATAFAHRNQRWVMQIKVFWKNETLEKECQNWSNRIVDAMGHHVNGAYVNYMDPLLENWQEMYYGENYARLKEIKRVYDPTGFFNFPRGIE